MKNTQPEVHDWQGGLPANEYYALKKKAQRLRGTYTEEQLDALDQMEKAWRAALPILSLKELVDIYPGSEGAAKRGLRSRMKAVEEQMSGLNAFRDVWQNTVINKANFRDQPQLRDFLTERCDTYLKEYNTEIKKLNYLMKSLDTTPEEVATSDGVTDEMIALAKQVPITSMVKVRRDGKTSCIYHTEKTSSMHIYKDNHFHCFGCGKTGDVIDIFMTLNNVSFTEAVKKML